MSLAATNLAMNYECVGQTAGSRDVEEPFQAAFNRAAAEVAAALQLRCGRNRAHP
jgi:hypothetical protein